MGEHDGRFGCALFSEAQWYVDPKTGLVSLESTAGGSRIVDFKPGLASHELAAGGSRTKQMGRMAEVAV